MLQAGHGRQAGAERARARTRDGRAGAQQRAQQQAGAGKLQEEQHVAGEADAGGQAEHNHEEGVDLRWAGTECIPDNVQDLNKPGMKRSTKAA